MKTKHLILIVVLFLGILMLVGCDGDEAQANPEQVVESFFTAMTSLDLDRAKGLVSSEYMVEFDRDMSELQAMLDADDEEAELMRKVFDSLFKRAELSATGHTIDGDVATVDTEIRMPDMEQFGEMLMAKMFELMFSEEYDFENMTDEDAMQLVVGLMEEIIVELDMVTQSGQAQLVLEDGQWKIDGDMMSDLFDEMDF